MGEPDTRKSELRRREWLARCGRGAALGAIATVTGVVSWRRAKANCPTPAVLCRQCHEWTRCVLPRAQQVRRSTVHDRDNPSNNEVNR